MQAPGLNFKPLGWLFGDISLSSSQTVPDMKQPYEKPETEIIAVELAHFFCSNQEPDPGYNPNGLSDYHGEPW
jgi:hypothetical protein